MKERLSATVFFAFCAAGALLGIGLAVTEALSDEPVTVGDVSESRRGLVTTVEAPVRNRSKSMQCPEVRAAARDGDANDLLEVAAQPVGAGTTAAIQPGQTLTYRATLALTREQYDEELDEISVYVYERHQC